MENKVSRWAQTSVRILVSCYDCGKPRYLFSKNLLSIQQKIQL